MIRSVLAALRFARSWYDTRDDLSEVEVPVRPRDEDEPVPGSLIAPAGAGALRGWVVLHGLTRPGRHHPELLRFARALASTGARVLVPEVPEWTRLRFAPERSLAILDGAVRWLAEDPGTRPGGVGLAGFSFGAPQAVLAASDPALAGSLRGVLAWGGYGDLKPTVEFQFTGEHEWEGRRHRLRPDPYGRWVVGANCLPLIPEFADRPELPGALRRLAAEAGDRRISALDPSLDPLKADLRERLSPRDREVFDLFAPVGDREPDPAEATELAAAMTEAARRSNPLLDPIPRVERLEVPVRLLHGRSDRLIPFTETLRVDRILRPKASDLKTGVTGLFAHAEGTGGGSAAARIRNGLHFLRMLKRVFEVG